MFYRSLKINFKRRKKELPETETQQIKVINSQQQACLPEFNPWNTHKGGRETLQELSCDQHVKESNFFTRTLCPDKLSCKHEAERTKCADEVSFTHSPFISPEVKINLQR